MQSLPFPRFLIPPRSIYSPQYHVFKHPQLPFLPECQRPSFTPIQNNWTQNIYFDFLHKFVLKTPRSKKNRASGIKNVCWSSCTVTVILLRLLWNWNFSTYLKKIFRFQNFMKIFQWKPSCNVQSKCDGTRWRRGVEVKGKLTNGLCS